MSRWKTFFICSAGCALIFAIAGTALAHPVAQGTMDVVVGRGGVRITAHVSMEEVIVSNTQGNQTPPGSTQEAIERHGFYMLNHITLRADDTTLSGRVVNAIEEDTPAHDKASYEFLFDLQPSKPEPARISIEQNVLSEFDFAPGNPWEAFYSLRLGMENSGSLEGLLGGKHPVAFGCTWKKDSAPVATQVPAPLNRTIEQPFAHWPLIIGAALLVGVLLFFAARR